MTSSLESWQKFQGHPLPGHRVSFFRPAREEDKNDPSYPLHKGHTHAQTCKQPIKHGAIGKYGVNRKEISWGKKALVLPLITLIPKSYVKQPPFSTYTNDSRYHLPRYHVCRSLSYILVTCSYFTSSKFPPAFLSKSALYPSAAASWAPSVGATPVRAPLARHGAVPQRCSDAHHGGWIIMLGMGTTTTTTTTTTRTRMTLEFCVAPR